MRGAVGPFQSYIKWLIIAPLTCRHLFNQGSSLQKRFSSPYTGHAKTREQLWRSTNNDPRRKATAPQAVPVRSLLKSEMTLLCTHVIARTEPTTWEPGAQSSQPSRDLNPCESWYSGKGHKTKPAVTSESEQAWSSNKERADGTRWQGCSWPEPELRVTLYGRH